MHTQPKVVTCDLARKHLRFRCSQTGDDGRDVTTHSLAQTYFQKEGIRQKRERREHLARQIYTISNINRLI
ncbi:hypothetical protein AAFF_G00143750 [Aldrovandia affinis]|uniref:Uncharacterized protein n=1 Tax=Aldrovandia affinis TaxID=143900 RepID=A0AAD7WX19_9TELE|nr:hypothetical protein AAFF_G00143750 [Aldrovandia affinis]